MLPVVAVRQQINDNAPGFRHWEPCRNRYVIGLEDSPVQPHVGTAGLLAVGEREFVPISVQIAKLMESSRRGMRDNGSVGPVAQTICSHPLGVKS